MTDWDLVRPELTGDIDGLIAEADDALDRIDARGPYTFVDGLRDVLLLGKLKSEAFPHMTEEQKQYFRDRIRDSQSLNAARRKIRD